MSRDRTNTHVDTVMIEAYAAQLLDAGAAASIERHLSCCDKCRANVAAAGTRGDLPGLGTRPSGEHLGRRDRRYRRASHHRAAPEAALPTEGG